MEHVETSELLDQWNNGNLSYVASYLHFAPRSEVVRFAANLDYNDLATLERRLVWSETGNEK